MPARPVQFDAALRRVDDALDAVAGAWPRQAIDRWRADAAAARFHLRRSEKDAPLVAVLGGTGTGKSTLVNRLLGQSVTAASFRRTFTAGPVAVVADPKALPPDWLNVPHVVAHDLPARGADGVLTVVPVGVQHSSFSILIDTPDLDGDTPAHPAQADRAFRWATACVFVVTPEKYQMTEVLPYYRLAARYGVPAAFVMNKCEEPAVLDDYRRLLAARDWPEAAVFAVPRDDAAYTAPPGADMAALQAWLAAVHRAAGAAAPRPARVEDLLTRLNDTILAPLRDERRSADALIASLRAMETPPPGVDVNPITQQLERRLQQRSVLYLMGPQRVIDRARQVPQLLARLPRAAWDYVMKGDASLGGDGNGLGDAAAAVPDFRGTLVDQFAVVKSRIDDAVRGDRSASAWADADRAAYGASHLLDAAAAAIAEEELDALRQWLEQKWNADPQDTKLVQRMLKVLPGGPKLAQWSETAPYLLAIVVAAHGALFGHIDLAILGAYGVATWLAERGTNEVAARTRQANKAIADRFTVLAHDQIRRTVAWVESRVPPAKAIDGLERAGAELESVVSSQ